MIITCNRILFPTVIDDDDEIIREAKMKHAAKNIRKRRVTFDLCDVEKFSEHEDSRFVTIWFYYSEPMVIEYDFAKLDEEYRMMHDENDNDDKLTYWIPLN